MSIGIVDHELPYDSHNLYDVIFFDDQIETLVTHTPSFVDSWIAKVENINSRRLDRLIVGLDVEWRPSFSRSVEYPVATIQLCVGLQCLVFQLIYAPEIPQSLVNFLSNPIYTFVGVGIESDIEKLIGDYGLSVSNFVDLRTLAVEGHGMRELRNAGLKDMARQVLGKEIVKPKRVTMSRWDQEWLNSAQVQYACLDAFISFEVGRSLNASGR